MFQISLDLQEPPGDRQMPGWVLVADETSWRHLEAVARPDEVSQ